MENSLRFMRKLDRSANLENWPQLYYPELYLLDGGYCSFFQQYPDFCEPRDYVSMFDRRFVSDCKFSHSQKMKKPQQQNKSKGTVAPKRSLNLSAPGNPNIVILDEHSLPVVDTDYHQSKPSAFFPSLSSSNLSESSQIYFLSNQSKSTKTQRNIFEVDKSSISKSEFIVRPLWNSAKHPASGNDIKAMEVMDRDRENILSLHSLKRNSLPSIISRSENVGVNLNIRTDTKKEEEKVEVKRRTSQKSPPEVIQSLNPFQN